MIFFCCKIDNLSLIFLKFVKISITRQSVCGVHVYDCAVWICMDSFLVGTMPSLCQFRGNNQLTFTPYGQTTDQFRLCVANSISVDG